MRAVRFCYPSTSTPNKHKDAKEITTSFTNLLHRQNQNEKGMQITNHLHRVVHRSRYVFDIPDDTICIVYDMYRELGLTC